MHPQNVFRLLRDGALHRSPVLIFRCLEFLLENFWILLRRQLQPTATTTTDKTEATDTKAAADTKKSEEEKKKKKKKNETEEEGREDEQKKQGLLKEGPQREEDVEEEPKLCFAMRRELTDVARKILYEPDYQRWLPGFVVRGMMGLPQVEFEAVTSVGGAERLPPEAQPKTVVAATARTTARSNKMVACVNK